MTNEATIAMADSDGQAPSMGAGGIIEPTDSIHISDAASAGAEVLNAFQSWNIFVRMIQPASWGFVAPDRVAVLENVSW